MNLAEDTQRLVTRSLREELSKRDGSALVGLSCLAQGADSLFAAEILSAGGELHAYLPSTTYRAQKVKPELAALFDELLARSAVVNVMTFDAAGRDAYEAANEAMLDACDELIAVWDGQAPVDHGGTAAVVHEAQRRGLPVTVIWPEGARRTST